MRSALLLRFPRAIRHWPHSPPRVRALGSVAGRRAASRPGSLMALAAFLLATTLVAVAAASSPRVLEQAVAPVDPRP